ncbi:MAG: DnaJ domain-containing protein [Chloroflexota bacterium]|nr:DnaJ domain-containing protein [Chloroflexota bacterium]
MKQGPDYYAVLQVDPRAEKEVVQAAYRRLAAKYHPDVDPSPGASDRMKLLNAAYEVISDPEKRKTYDLYRAGHRRQEEPASREPLRHRQRWWLLPVAVIVLLVAFRLSPRLLLILAPLFLVLWLVWRWRTSNPS